MALQDHHMIEFWFDFSSGYAYFAALEIEALAARHGRAVLWRPFMLGSALKRTGLTGLSSTPIKGDYARHDWQRLARRQGVPFAPPSFHPITALPCSRAFYWIEQQQPQHAAAYAKAVFRAYYGSGADLRNTAAAAALAAPLGIDAAALAAAIETDAVKQHFRRVSESGLERGVFGSPYFIVDGEPFWGWDRLPLLDDWLTRNGW